MGGRTYCQCDTIAILVMMRYIRRGAQLCAPTDLVFHRIEKGYISLGNYSSSK
ncbi:MAG: hypothetical protein CLLPBCKN_004963 [Chroococcidiopsis cubana SAG 39.79]|nr:hypothetical protein [Chroococcidiopsis cubana SAG 39.79]